MILKVKNSELLYMYTGNEHLSKWIEARLLTGIVGGYRQPGVEAKMIHVAIIHQNGLTFSLI